MRNDTRALFNRFVSTIAQLNGVADATQRFTVDPTVEQKLETKVQESSEFLQRINVFGVDELKGEKVGITMSGMIAARTNVAAGGVRQPTDPSGLVARGYELFETEFDIQLRWALIDAWAKFPDFAQRIQAAVAIRIALDRIAIGWNGVGDGEGTFTVPAQSDKAGHPDRVDMNLGWFELLRRDRPLQLKSHGNAGAGSNVTVGSDGGDYATIDALVWDLVQSGLPSWAVNDPDLVVLCGRGLLHDKYFPLINADRDPTQQIARDTIMAGKRLGNLPAYQVPYFPPNKVMVTPFKNLSLYYQNGARRRQVRDWPDTKSVQDFQSSNEAYVVEDYDFVVAAENIELLESAS